MDFSTKFEVGQKLFWIDQFDNQYRVNFSEIKSIKIGGKVWERYEIGNTTRSERELWEDFEEAKAVCLHKQKVRNDELLKTVDEQKNPADKGICCW